MCLTLLTCFLKDYTLFLFFLILCQHWYFHILQILSPRLCVHISSIPHSFLIYFDYAEIQHIHKNLTKMIHKKWCFPPCRVNTIVPGFNKLYLSHDPLFAIVWILIVLQCPEVKLLFLTVAYWEVLGHWEVSELDKIVLLEVHI